MQFKELGTHAGKEYKEFESMKFKVFHEQYQELGTGKYKKQDMYFKGIPWKPWNSKKFLEVHSKEFQEFLRNAKYFTEFPGTDSWNSLGNP